MQLIPESELEIQQFLQCPSNPQGVSRLVHQWALSVQVVVEKIVSGTSFHVRFHRWFSWMHTSVEQSGPICFISPFIGKIFYCLV